MRGISTVIATILMLMITIALAGTAYLYISGAITQQMQGLGLVDAYCVQHNSTHDNATIIVRNLGTEAVSTNTITIVQSSPPGPVNVNWNPTTINPGSSATMVEFCEGSGDRTCVYRIVPPAGRSVQATVNCPG
ncbi:MAG: archaellin/type IV pilin N-terminal domain-containing protein [Candidatus Aenigmatarchaeota archaeon]